MKIRELLRKFRLRPLSPEAQKLVDASEDASSIGGMGGAMAPPNWVPSQQDERPH